MIPHEIEMMNDGKNQSIIKRLNDLCRDGYCQNRPEKYFCTDCPLVKESIKRFGVDVLVTD